MLKPFNSPSLVLSHQSINMPFEEEPDPNPPTIDHVRDWLLDSISFLPSFPDEPYDYHEIDSHQWWDPDQDLVDASSFNSTPILLPNPPALSGPSRKRKEPNALSPKTSHQRRNKSYTETLSGDDNIDNDIEAQETVRKPVNTQKRTTAKGTGNQSHNNNGHKDAKWADQLLNPCALAISTGNLSRVHHLLYVLYELASPSGDANHRLAAYGLHALTSHLSSSVSIPTIGTTIVNPLTFASTEPRLFLNSLIKFHEFSPWFSFPNVLANASILQTLSSDATHQNLHILDIGVTHGVQWPTLLESLTRRPGGPPQLVRLTIVAATDNPASFSVGPPGDDYPSRLLRYAKTIDLNLEIDIIENYPLQTLTPQILGVSSQVEETLIVCAQFRIHQLTHEDPDDRTEFLQQIRNLEPDLVVLTENEGECSCSNCGDFATSFPRRVEFLWKFLDSTSIAFKGRECEERRLMEGEAATALVNTAEMNEGKVGWCGRMRALGFVGECFGEEAMEGGRALLRKNDSNWEMRVEEKGDGCIWLCWKRQPLSFCSLWKLPAKKS